MAWPMLLLTCAKACSTSSLSMVPPLTRPRTYDTFASQSLSSIIDNNVYDLIDLSALMTAEGEEGGKENNLPSWRQFSNLSVDFLQSVSPLSVSATQAQGLLRLSILLPFSTFSIFLFFFYEFL